MYQNDGLITLLISCPDQPGIVAAVSHFIFERQGNIVYSDQHSTDRHISCIISNHRYLEHIAQIYTVPYYHFPVRREHRQDDQQRILDFLATRVKVDLIILARYMQILEPCFVQAYPHQIINIHHSFLPAFVGANPYERAFERGVKIIGATAHYVTEELDEGPIIAQDVIHCTHRDTVEDLMRKGRDVERRVLAEAVRLHIEDRVLMYKNKTIVF